MTLAFRLRHRFPGIALDVAFEAPTPGVTVLFGPSGSGKSTVIRAAAGLLRPDECSVLIDGRALVDTGSKLWIPPERRRIGLVFQDAKLFPHMTVAGNLRFGMRRAGRGEVRFDDVVDLLGIGALLDRRPRTLSGGERQRVAIGRALLANPLLLLLDEPLASLDEARKAEIIPFLRRLKASLRLPMVYVTHAPAEVAQLADTLVLLEAGRVTAFGTLHEMTGRADLPLARRDDAASVLTCRVAEHDRARLLTRLEANGVPIWVPDLDLPPGSECRVRIPAKEVALAAQWPEAISIQNIFAGIVGRIVPDAAGRSVIVEVTLDAGPLLARVTPDAVTRLGLTPDAPVLALVKSTSVDVFP